MAARRESETWAYLSRPSWHRARGYALTLERETWRLIMEGVAAGDLSREELAQRFAEEMGDDVTLED